MTTIHSHRNWRSARAAIATAFSQNCQYCRNAPILPEFSEDSSAAAVPPPPVPPRAEPVFYAFDILWDEHAKSDDEEELRRFRNGEDTRYLPLTDCKQRLRTVVPKQGERLLYCDHVEGDSEALFRLTCEQGSQAQLPSVSPAAYELVEDPEPWLFAMAGTRGAF